MSAYYSHARYRCDSVFLLRKLARDISAHRADPVELGLDLDEMRDKAMNNADPFVRELAVRYLQRRQFGPSRDPRRAAA